ncbi:MAG: DUF4105 domain-containing protein [Treponema sp.]|jgi:hypothetical protein|nr:DUF4105 domain-containing protein [Treponema sp.]
MTGKDRGGPGSNQAEIFRFLVFFLCFLAAGSVLFAQTGEEDPLVLKLAVIGPGDELYFWWGHIGLIVEDSERGTARFYDWGVFSFENENFFVNFALGRLIYACMATPEEWNLGNYIATNRDITLYTLDLPASTKQEMRAFAEWNVLPENRDYFYHHFKDNCSTRIRDILDTALDGQFKALYGEAPGRYTLRQHVRRHTWFNPFFDWALNFWMGQDIDTPVTVWEEMFLPAEVGSRIAEFSYTGPDGRERKLVRAVETMNRASGRPPVLDAPRRQWPAELALGLVIALVMGALLFRARGGGAAQTAWALAQGALGLFFGVMGLILFFMTFFTNHDYTWHNSNVIFVNPLLLAALPLGIALVKTDYSDKKAKLELAIKILWSYVLVFGLLSFLLRLLPFFWQQNQVTLALVLPFAAVLSLLPELAGSMLREYFWRWIG